MVVLESTPATRLFALPFPGRMPRCAPNVSLVIVRMPRLLAVLSAALCFLAAPLAAECVGHNLFDTMDPARRAEVQAAADAVPFAKGNFWQATKGDQVITLAGTYHFDDPRHAASLAALMPAITGASTKVSRSTKWGVQSSLKNILIMSATIWKAPKGPTRLGP